MKKQQLYILGLLFLCFTWWGCEEIPPDITLNCDTDRVVLVEEFTGVKCVNCPAGSEKIEQLLDIYPDNLIAVSVHAGFFSKPFDSSPEDFTTADGEALDALLGPVTGWPAATVNRKTFDGESERILSINSWAGYISEELCQAPKITVEITTSFDTDSRVLSVEVTGTGIENVAESLGLSVMLTENNITAPQTTPTNSEDVNYVHKHVLRDFITDITGETIHSGGSIPSNYSKTYSYTLPTGWTAENCYVIAAVHGMTDNTRDVFQAAEKKIMSN
ncbi:MAG: Omp28 family outer membrane lipoprotein [Saprospiraceae bacterium]|nr:Omp28 family outer membrane lipoprotein [Saprospiraceae bacterium]